MNRETSSRIKKYGVCLSQDCAQYKQVQEIVHGDMECPVCHKKLSPCPPPKKKSNKKLPIIVGVAILAIAIIVGCIVAFSNSKEAPKENAAVATDSSKVVAPAVDSVNIKTDTVVVRDTIVQDNTTIISEKTNTKTVVNTTTPAKSSQSASASGSGTLRLSYGTYTGATKNGYPHGQGRLTYTTTRQINRNDAKARTANAGDYVIGEFYNGFVVYGKHYDSAGNLLGSLNIGVGNESSYESK